MEVDVSVAQARLLSRTTNDVGEAVSDVLGVLSRERLIRRSQRGPILRRHVMNIIHRHPASRTRKIARHDAGIAGNMIVQMTRHQTRMEIIGGAGRAARIRDEFIPKAAMNPDGVADVDAATKGAIAFNFLQKPLTPDELRGLIQIPAR
jgi:hypothetical protein